jgi:hypothetical protein
LHNAAVAWRRRYGGRLMRWPRLQSGESRVNSSQCCHEPGLALAKPGLGKLVYAFLLRNLRL